MKNMNKYQNGADKLAENTQNTPKMFGPICLPVLKSLGYSKKSSLWVSVVRGLNLVLGFFKDNLEWIGVL